MDDQQRARELLPCPFCGDEAKHTVWSDHHYHRVGCESCDVEMDHFQDKADAFEAWNRRAALCAVPEGFVMVPVELDSTMLLVWRMTLQRGGSYQQAWTAMLAARPQGVK